MSAQKDREIEARVNIYAIPTKKCERSCTLGCSYWAIEEKIYVFDDILKNVRTFLAAIAISTQMQCTHIIFKVKYPPHHNNTILDGEILFSYTMLECLQVLTLLI